MAGRGKAPVEFGDGVLTGRGTFQKFFDQGELKTYLETHLETDAIPAAPGVFYLFRDESARQAFLANRCRRRELPPRKRLSERLFAESRELLGPLMDAVAVLGRLPEPEEFPPAAAVAEKFGSLKRLRPGAKGDRRGRMGGDRPPARRGPAGLPGPGPVPQTAGARPVAPHPAGGHEGVLRDV